MTDNQSDALAAVAAVTPEEIEAMRAENEALKAQLAEASSTKSTASSRWRSIIAWILVVLAVLSVVLAVFSVWLKSTITDEDRFVSTFGVLPEQEAIVTALSQRVADDLIVAAAVEESLAESLPPNVAFLSVPVTEGVRQLTTQVAGEIIASDIFAGIWRAALRVSHQAVGTVLATEGRVVIDLDEAAASVADELADRGVTVFEGQEIDLPEIVLFESEQIAAAAQVVNLVDTLGWLTPLIALLLIAAAIGVSPNRRKTVAFLGFGSGVALLLDLAMFRVIRSSTVSSIGNDVSREAAEAAWAATLRFYLQGVWGVILLAFVVGFVAWAFGPSALAVRLRTAWNAMLARWSRPESAGPRTGAAKFVYTWKHTIQWGAVILGILFTLLGPVPSFASVTVTALIVLAVVGGAQVVAGPDPVEPGGAKADDKAPVVAGTEASE